MIGTRLGNFEITEEIGRGGMGVVYRARQVSLNRVVALKVIEPGVADDEVAAERFRREAHAMAQLQHPNIVDVIEVGEQDGLRYFAMQYVEGPSLAQVISERGALPAEETAQIAAQVADALQQAHERGVVHRDIKPENILIAPDGRPVVTDFGIARAMEGMSFSVGDSLTQGVIGTPEYMSPEIIRGNPVDGRTDLYSLGVVLYQMITGRVPFTATTPFEVASQHLTARPNVPEAEDAACPHWLGTIILRAMAKEPAGRFFSAAEMAAALRARQVVTAVSAEEPAPAVTLTETQQPSTQTQADGGEVSVASRSGAGTSRVPGFAIAIALAVAGMLLLGASVVMVARPSTQVGGGVPHSEEIEVPSVAGLSLGEALRAIEDADLVPFTDGIEDAPLVFDEEVIAQHPSAGQLVRRSTAVRLTIGRLPQFESSDLEPVEHDLRRRLDERYWRWLDAWQARNLPLFLSFYASDCEIERIGRPSYGKPTLEKRMADDFARNSYISIDSHQPKIEVTGDTATLSAWQHYDSSTWWDKGTKSLGWRYDGDDWYIVWESFSMSSGGAK